MANNHSNLKKSFKA